MLLRRTRNLAANPSRGAKPRTTRKPPVNHPPPRPASGGCRRPRRGRYFFSRFRFTMQIWGKPVSGSAPGDKNSSILREQNPRLSLSRLLSAYFVRFSMVWGGVLWDVYTQYDIPGTGYVSIYWQYILLCQYLALPKSPLPADGCLTLAWCLVP